MSNLFEDLNQFLNTPHEEENDEGEGQHIIKHSEVERLILSLATMRGEKGFTDEDTLKLVRWAENALVASALLNLVLEGAADVDWDSEANEPLFISTDYGNKLLERYKHGEFDGAN